MQIRVEELERPVAIQWERGMTDDEYFQFCANNSELRVERTSEGDIVIIPPAGLESGHRNQELSRQLGLKRPARPGLRFQHRISPV